MFHSGFHYICNTPNNVELAFYDEVNDKDYPICLVENLTQGIVCVRILQESYRRVCVAEEG